MSFNKVVESLEMYTLAIIHLPSLICTFETKKVFFNSEKNHS